MAAALAVLAPAVAQEPQAGAGVAERGVEVDVVGVGVALLVDAGPAPHEGMDVERFRADFRDWWQRSNDPEVLAALREVVAYFAREETPGP